MIVNITGLCKPENIREVCQLNVDWIGLNFCQTSPRYLAQVSSRGGFIPDYTSIRDERLSLGSPVDTTVRQENKPLRVGLFCNEMPQTIVTRIYNFKLDFVQLEGDESPVMIENLRRTIEPDIRTGVKIIKTIHVSSAEDMKKGAEFEGVADYLLFKAPAQMDDVAEQPFDWDLIAHYEGKTPFLVAGAIGADSVEKLRDVRHPLFAGIEVGAKFETEPGMIDVPALNDFLKLVK